MKELLPDSTPHYVEQIVPEYRGNPLIEALPSILTEAEACKRMAIRPPYAASERKLAPEIRWHLLGRLPLIVIPELGHYAMERTASRMIRQSYVMRHPLEPGSWRRIYGAQQLQPSSYQDHRLLASDAQLVQLGLSGTGKTTIQNAILRCYPQQVIRHTKYKDRDLQITQVVYLAAKCPQDASFGSLVRECAFNLDLALGTDLHFKEASKPRITQQELEAKLFQWAATYFFGILWIDDTQNLRFASSDGAKRFQARLMALRDGLKVPIALNGTPRATMLFKGELQYARRAIENGLFLCNRQCGDPSTRRAFLGRLLSYQWTAKKVPITEELLTTFDLLTAGIKALDVTLWKLGQEDAITSGTEVVTPDSLKRVAETALAFIAPAIDALHAGKTNSFEMFEDLMPPNEILARLTLEQAARLSDPQRTVKDPDASGDEAKAAGQSKAKQGTGAKAPAKFAAAELPPGYRDLRDFAKEKDRSGALRKAGLVADDLLAA